MSSDGTRAPRMATAGATPTTRAPWAAAGPSPSTRATPSSTPSSSTAAPWNSMPPPSTIPTRTPPSMPPPTTVPRSQRYPAASQPPSPAPADAVVLPSDPALPAPILHAEENVHAWPQTPGYRGFIDWLKVRCARIKGVPIVEGDAAEGACEATRTYLRLLDDMASWIDEAPPLPQENQRFGNRAFRDYIAIVEARLPSYFPPTLPPHLRDQLLPLLLQSHAFGHPTRLDYGTGHELAFVLSLFLCVVSGWVTTPADQDQLVLRVFPRYLSLVTTLQSRYRLEPAGSHGVWGLDDFAFLPYLFGSAQLLGSDTTPAQALDNAIKTDGSFTDLYTLSLHRITLFKRGAAFSEHSPLLDSLAQFPNWIKPHAGLLKMFQAEVLGKRVVVQGLWIGGWCWGENVPQLDERQRGDDEEPTAEGGAPIAAPWKMEKLRRANASWGV